MSALDASKHKLLWLSRGYVAEEVGIVVGSTSRALTHRIENFTVTFSCDGWRVTSDIIGVESCYAGFRACLLCQ